MNRVVPVDWPKLLAQLEAAGWTRYKVTQTLSMMAGRNIDKKTVATWRLGQAQPHHFEGQLLLALSAESRASADPVRLTMNAPEHRAKVEPEAVKEAAIAACALSAWR